MREIFCLIIVTIFFVLTACASTVKAPGSYDDSKKSKGYVWKEITVDNNYKDIYRHMTTMFQTCGPDEVLTPPNITSNIYPEIGEANITLSTPSGIPRGAIRIKKSSKNRSRVRIGVMTSFEDPVWRSPRGLRESWAQLARGKSC